MQWDYIVIGAGSAGCALTHELVKTGKSILVLEAGGADRSLYIKIPALVLQADKKFDWGYQAQPDPSRAGAVEHWTRGKVLGGSSSINGTVYVRGAAEDFDRWAAHCGNQGGWSAREVMPLFREIETSDQPGALRGQAGPLHVTTVKQPHALTQAFIKSAAAAGHPLNEDYNGLSQEGVSLIQLTVRRGLRWSAADAFLKPHLGRKNLRLLLNAFVEKIELDGGRATAVVFRREGQQRRETARDVILCAGAINSPKLLMLSGIGDAQELKRCGIDVVLDVPGVGQNLKDHPLSYLVYRTKTPTNNPTEGLLQKIRIAVDFIRRRSGPIANIWEGAAFLKSSSSAPTPDIQAFFTPVGYAKTPNGELKIAPYPSITIGIAKSYTAGSGRVRLRSRLPDDPPLIEYSLLEHQDDVDTLARGVEAIRRIMKTEPIASVIEDETLPGSKIEGMPMLGAFIRKNSGVCFHSIGTCRMGLDGDAVVGPDLRVRGIESLWVADASIFPGPISANINGACMMIGAKLGKRLATRR
jgi:choline dehydrogenase